MSADVTGHGWGAAPEALVPGAAASLEDRCPAPQARGWGHVCVWQQQRWTLARSTENEHTGFKDVTPSRTLRSTGSW